jgi:hypothetical protein
MPRKPRRVFSSTSSATAARRIKQGQVGVRERMRIPAALELVWETQTPESRGSTWANGYYFGQHLKTLYRVLSTLSGSDHTSFIVGADSVTLLVGQDSFTGVTITDAVLNAIAFYLPPQQGADEFEQRLIELDLLE